MCKIFSYVYFLFALFSTEHIFNFNKVQLNISLMDHVFGAVPKKIVITYRVIEDTLALSVCLSLSNQKPKSDNSEKMWGKNYLPLQSMVSSWASELISHKAD
jgi:hypothetical protein